MSYKLHESGRVSPNGMVTGVEPEVYDECEIGIQGRVVTIQKGRLFINGYGVEIDGYEVITVPESFGTGTFGLVGALRVVDGTAKSFVISIRNGLDLTVQDLDTLGERVCEILLAKIVVGSQNSFVERQIGLLKSEDSQRLDGWINGSAVTVTDSNGGKLQNVRIKGNSVVLGGNINHVPSEFNILIEGKNFFDYENAEVYDREQVGLEKGHIVAEDVSGVVEKCENGFYALGWRANSGSILGNGLLTFNFESLMPENYVFSMKLKMIDGWSSGNSKATVVFFANGLEVDRTEVDLSDGTTKTYSCDFVPLSQKPSVQIYLNGMKVFIHDIQIEQGSTASEYEPYTKSNIKVKVKDIEGNACELRATKDSFDEIVKEKGEYYLIKRTEVTNQAALDGGVKHTYVLSSLYGEVETIMSDILVMPGETVLYTMKTPQKILLDQGGVKCLDNLYVGRGRVKISFSGITLPTIVARYKKI